MPKVKMYLFLSIICLLINFCVFATALINIPTSNVDDFYVTDDKEVNVDDSNVLNTTITGLGLSAGFSFVPFFSVVSLVFYFPSLPDLVTVFTSIIFVIIGAVQVFLLAMIILNIAPKVLGSGFDV